MKIVAISDLHLDRFTEGVDRYDETRRVLENAVEHALTHDAAAFLFLGDLCDPNTVRSHRSVAALVEAFVHLTSYGVDVVAIPGNHDVIEDGSGLSTLAPLGSLYGVELCTEPTMTLVKGKSESESESESELVKVMALPFTPSSHTYDPVEFVRSSETVPDIVIGHLNLEGITPGSETKDMPRGRDVFWPLEALHEKYPNALLLGGHYHQRQCYRGVHIVGSAVRLTFGERQNDCGFAVIEV